MAERESTNLGIVGPRQLPDQLFGRCSVNVDQDRQMNNFTSSARVHVHDFDEEDDDF